MNLFLRFIYSTATKDIVFPGFELEPYPDCPASPNGAYNQKDPEVKLEEWYRQIDGIPEVDTTFSTDTSREPLGEDAVKLIEYTKVMENR